MRSWADWTLAQLLWNGAGSQTGFGAGLVSNVSHLTLGSRYRSENMLKIIFPRYRAAEFLVTRRTGFSTICSRQLPGPPWPRPRPPSRATVTACPCPGCTRDTSTETWSWTLWTATAQTRSSTWSRLRPMPTNYCPSSTRPRRVSINRQFRRPTGPTRRQSWTGRITRSTTPKSYPAPALDRCRSSVPCRTIECSCSSELLNHVWLKAALRLHLRTATIDSSNRLTKAKPSFRF